MGSNIMSKGGNLKGKIFFFDGNRQNAMKAVNEITELYDCGYYQNSEGDFYLEVLTDVAGTIRVEKNQYLFLGKDLNGNEVVKVLDKEEYKKLF